MITESREVNKYKDINKQYIPQDYINSNWYYRYNGDYIIITTDQQCYQNYNTTYCNCIEYNWKTNVMENMYQCARQTSNHDIQFSNITNDINYSERITTYYIKDKITQFGIIILGVLIAMLLLRERKAI